MPTVTFHVLSDPAPDAALRHACRIAERAVNEGKRVFVRVTDNAQAKRIDDLLWTFGDRSFLPHELASPGAPSHDRVRILIGGDAPPDFRELLINLGADLPSDTNSLHSIAELVPADDERKRAARARFKSYRDAGVEPVTHNV
jgi:DNA polymerase III subunit chi